jgi:hypothetical protein
MKPWITIPGPDLSTVEGLDAKLVSEIVVNSSLGFGHYTWGTLHVMDKVTTDEVLEWWDTLSKDQTDRIKRWYMLESISTMDLAGTVDDLDPETEEFDYTVLEVVSRMTDTWLNIHILRIVGAADDEDEALWVRTHDYVCQVIRSLYYTLELEEHFHKALMAHPEAWWLRFQSVSTLSSGQADAS